MRLKCFKGAAAFSTLSALPRTSQWEYMAQITAHVAIARVAQSSDAIVKMIVPPRALSKKLI